MIVYLIMLILCCIGGLIANRTKTNKKFAFMIIFLPLFLVSGLRYMVGKDYLGTYVNIFYKIASGTTNVRVDWGFYILNKFVLLFSESYQWIFIITSFIINFIIVKTILKKSNDKLLSTFIYICGTLYFFSMNGVRQCIALALFYYSLQYIENKNLKKYLFINIIGCLFHNSAIIFIPLYFFLDKRVNLKIKLIIMALLYFNISYILPIINNFLLGTKYSMYITNGAYSPLKTINISTIINIILFILYEVFYKKNKNDKIYNIYNNIHFIGVLVSLFTTKIPLAIRIFVYFRYIEYLSVPYLLSKMEFSKKSQKAVNLLVIILYFIYFIHGVYYENGNDVLPYKSILDK